jgi:anaerobic magnesium-protoporphyrin IX monomethyl ester cyclase
MKVLLINPSQRFLYSETKIKAGAIYSPVLSLAMIGAPLTAAGIKTELIDFNIHDEKRLAAALGDMEVKFAGITFTTPLYDSANAIAGRIKQARPDITLVCGGPHVTSLPEETMENSFFDIGAAGEADLAMLEIVTAADLSTVAGIYYKKDGKIRSTRPGPRIRDLDKLPYPAWGLYDIKAYEVTGLLSENNPVGWLETSRGCVFECVYCNKNIFGRNFRVKSPGRVVDEMQYMVKAGFREIHIADDGFTTDMARAEKICDEMIARGLKVPWATVTGIRVDRVSPQLLRKMKKAGCYRVYYGIETGDEQVLKNINKKITLGQVADAVRWSREAGLEVFGFFMFGLPGESIGSMKKTIELSLKLDLDMAKASIMVPLPSTRIFNTLESAGKIKTRDWSKYNLYLPASAIYDHAGLDWKTIEKYYSSFYRKFYLRAGYILKTILRSLVRGRFLLYLKYFLQTRW